MPEDLVKLVDRLKKDREEFWLSKTQWKRSKVPKTLVWNSVIFRRSESTAIPATRGVYAFQIKYSSGGIPQHGYLMYVGETGNRNSQETLRSRFLSYFSEMQAKERSLHYVLCKYEDYLYFHYSPISDRRRNLKNIEAWLCDTLVPPYNVKDFSVEMRKAKKAL